MRHTEKAFYTCDHCGKRYEQSADDWWRLPPPELFEIQTVLEQRREGELHFATVHVCVSDECLSHAVLLLYQKRRDALHPNTSASQQAALAQQAAIKQQMGKS